MLGISGEHILILIGILVIFGPRRLPEAGAALGRAARKFREQWNGIHEPAYRKLDEKPMEANHVE